MNNLIELPNNIDVSLPENSFVYGLGVITVTALLQPVKDIVGLAGGHWLHAQSERMKNRFDAATRRLKDRGVEPITPSPSIAIPLMQASLDEDREELQKIWTALLEAAMDPDRCGFMRKSFLIYAKELDPQDAIVFESVVKFSKLSEEERDGTSLDFWAEQEGIRFMTMLTSFDHLDRLGLSHFGDRNRHDLMTTRLTNAGWEFASAIGL